jgi:hypothetical protein
MSRTRLACALALITLAGAAGSTLAQPISSSFVYQGELRSAGSLHEGTADVRFSLWSAPTAGSLIGTPVEALDMDLTDGRFSVMLNAGGEFGTAVFNGERRWIEISVRSPGSGGVYEILSPRQELTSTPYASHAADSGTVGGLTPAQLRTANALTGTLPDTVLSNNIPLRGANQTFSGSNTFTGANLFNNTNNTYLGNGAGLTALNASNILSGTLTDARLSSNVALRSANQTFSGSNTFTGANLFNNTNNTYLGNGAGLGALNASNIASGMLSDARLSSNVAQRNTNQTFTGANTFSAITSFNDRIGVGTTPSSEFRMHLSGGTGQWKGGIAASGASYAVVMGELGGRATIGSNNAAITTWQDLMINPFGKVLVGGGAQAPTGATLQVGSGTPASLGAASGFFAIGATGGANLVFDSGGILARTAAGTAAPLRLNATGGNVVVPAIEFSDGTVLTSAASIRPVPIVLHATTSYNYVVPAGGSFDLPLSAPGAQPGMGVMVNPTTALPDANNFIGYTRINGPGAVVVKLINQGNSDTAYVSRAWTITLFPN